MFFKFFAKVTQKFLKNPLFWMVHSFDGILMHWWMLICCVFHILLFCSCEYNSSRKIFPLVLPTSRSDAEFIGNKVKRQISKRVFQENKARQIFRKTNIFYPLLHTRTYAYLGVRNVCFSDVRVSGGKKCSFFNTRSEIRSFALLPTSYC